MVIRTYMNIIRTIVTTIMKVVSTVWRTVWGIFGPIIRGVFAIIKAIIQVALAWIRVYITTMLRIYQTVFRSVWNAITSVVRTALNLIRSVVSSILNAVTGIVRTAANAAKSAFSGPWNALSGIVSTAVNKVMGVVNGIRGRITGALSGIGTWLADSGSRLIQGLIDGITAKAEAVGRAMSNIASKIKGFMPGSPIKEGPLRDAGWNQGEPGEELVNMLAMGIAENVSAIEQAFAGLSVGVPTVLAGTDAALAASASRTAVSAVAPQTFPLGAGLTIKTEVNAPQNMSPTEVGDAVAQKVATRVTTGAPAVPPPVRSR
jgi:phage-related protein